MSSRDLEADSIPFCIERSKHDIYPFISPHAGLKGCAKGKTVLVTGGSSGIGITIAKYFALAGADAVIICGRTVTALEEARFAIQTAVPSCKVSWTHADVTSPESVENLFRSIPFKYLDILVNNAGAAASQEEIRDSDVIDWWSDFELNVKGVYLCSRAYLRRRNGKPGVILNVSSSVSNVVNPGLSSYAVSKTAVNRLTEFIHAEYANENIRCIAFHPGGIADSGMGHQAPANLRQNLIDTTDLAAGTALYLSTPRALYLSGRFVYANWDMEELQKKMEYSIVWDDLLKTRVTLGAFLSSNPVLR